MAVAAALWIFWMRGEPGADSAPSGAARVSGPEVPVEARPGAGAEGDAPAHRIPSGGRLSLEAARLPAGGPLELELIVPPEARQGSEPLAVRVLDAERGRQLEATARLGAEGVHVALDPAWLRSGRYIIELRTTDRSHFPLRRFVLVIR